MSLHRYMAAMTASILVFGLAACDKSAAPEYLRPGSNVILISMDTLRADHLGCYGYAKDASPNIDAFSREGTLFETVIAPSPATKSSHASMFTSLNVVSHGALDDFVHVLPDEVNTMAEIFRDEDYSTACINGGGNMKAVFGLNQGFDIYNSNYTGDFIKNVQATLQWLKANPGKRFFLCLHTYQVHHPYTPEARFAEMFDHGYSGDLPEHISIDLLKEINDGKITISDDDRKHIVNRYDAEIRSMDEAFGVFIKGLKRQGLYNDSLIIVTSDHGEEFGEHGKMGWHCHTVYDELLRVPLIIKFPDSQYKSRRITGMARTIDILPTMVDLLGMENSPDFEGVSLMPSIEMGRVSNDYAVCQLGAKPWLRTERWKLFESRLYDLEEDPGETKDASEENQQVKNNLKSALKKVERRTGFSKETRLDEETIKELQGLGYAK